MGVRRLFIVFFQTQEPRHEQFYDALETRASAERSRPDGCAAAQMAHAQQASSAFASILGCGCCRHHQPPALARCP
jgi:hypothetical protein